MWHWSAGLAGLLLTATLDLTDRLTWMLRQTTEVELNMNSVERILEYTDLPLELDTIQPAARCASNPIPDPNLIPTLALRLTLSWKGCRHSVHGESRSISRYTEVAPRNAQPSTADWCLASHTHNLSHLASPDIPAPKHGRPDPRAR